MTNVVFSLVNHSEIDREKKYILFEGYTIINGKRVWISADYMSKHFNIPMYKCIIITTETQLKAYGHKVDHLKLLKASDVNG